MTINAIRVTFPDSLSSELREEADVFFKSLCRRLTGLSEEDQRKLIAELNNFVTFYDPEHLIRP